MKKLFVLAAGLLQLPVIKKAKEMGYFVIAADDDPNAPGMALADKAIVPGGLMNEEKMVAMAKDEHIDGVIHPCSEVAMNVMGRINDELGLCGISKEIAIRATNNHSVPVAILTNQKDNSTFNIFPSLYAKEIIKTYSVDELFDVIMKHRLK